MKKMYTWYNMTMCEKYPKMYTITYITYFEVLILHK